MKRIHIYIVLLLLPWASASASVVTTKHNLSVSGPGSVRASQESQVCIFCHTPHNASPSSPLWNRRDPGSSYTPYNSSTAVASPGQPTGASLLCLSCHDGTIALGDVLSRSTNISMRSGVSTMPTGPGRLGTDLSDDHPISFTYNNTLANQNGELVNPSTLTNEARLDSNGRLQCTACHDAHDNTYGKFLVKNNIRSGLCITCHDKNHWSQTAHSTSSRQWNGSGQDPWPNTQWNNVRDNACLNCHQPHNAPGRQRLLKHVQEEDNCIVCHNGNVASKNIANEFNKFSQHPIDMRTGAHRPDESNIVNSPRHVECVDCHNPHAARSGGGNPPGPLTGVKGITISGGNIGNITSEYQLCFRCHSSSSGKPAPRTTRQISQTNTRLEFLTTNPSFHPVAGPGRNQNVPSLISPLTTSSVISCTDCHNNDNSNGPNGPHGSNFEPILKRQYLTNDPTPESASAYALCYQCHDRNSILGNESFSRHNLHITGMGGMGGGGMGGMGGNLSTPCNVCHDPHGINGGQGNSVNNSKLINFDRSVVSPSSSGILRFESTGTFSGRCYLTCHNQNHDPKSYPGGMGGGGGGGGGMGGGM
jgi:predicted CXXCH cytochrome family protein